MSKVKTEIIKNVGLILIYGICGLFIYFSIFSIRGPRAHHYRVVELRDGRYAAQACWPSIVWVNTTVGTLNEARTRVEWERKFVKKPAPYFGARVVE